MIYAFAINEFRWKRVGFTKHRTEEAAARAIRKRYKYKGSASSDFDFYELTKEGLEKWASDCNYKIDWENQLLISEEA